jgi:N-acetylglutamate synthase-like GNAT family acetyltransferase
VDVYTVREAKREEQRELTRLCVRATMHAGHDEAFIDRSMPGLTITLPLISADCVQVAQDNSSEVVGVVAVTPTMLQGIALLHGIFVDPALETRDRSSSFRGGYSSRKRDESRRPHDLCRTFNGRVL